MADVIKTFNPAEANKVETVLILKQCRVKPVNEEKSRRALPGEKYQVSGMDKVELLARGLATLDMKAEIPASTKKTHPRSKEAAKNK